MANLVPPSAAAVLADAVEAYVSDRLSRAELRPISARQLRWRLGTLVAACPPGLAVADLDREALLDWQRTIAAHRPATRRAYLSTVRTFCRWAVAEGLLGADPTRGLAVREPRSVPRALSAPEMGRLRAVLPDLRARLVVALMAREGLRCAEVSGLGVADWDRAAGSLRVHGKGGHVRVLPLAGDVEMLLAGWVGERRSGPLVGLKPATLSTLVAGWMAAAGIKGGRYDGISAHALRHTAASDFYDRTRDIRAAQRLLGHANLGTTDRYLRHADDQALRAGLNPVLSLPQTEHHLPQTVPHAQPGKASDSSSVRAGKHRAPDPAPARPRLVLVASQPPPKPSGRRITPPGPVSKRPARACDDAELAAARQRVAAAAAAEEEAAAALAAARAERLAANQAVAALADAARLYWDTDLPVGEIAARLGLPPSHRRTVYRLAGPRVGECPRCGYPQATRYSRGADPPAVSCPACHGGAPRRELNERLRRELNERLRRELLR